MKRSEINAIIKDAMAFADRFSFRLPPFADWTPADWATKGHECDEIRDNMLGWDITDYGLGKFSEVGLVLVTIRNGNQNNPKYEKPYAEKLLISDEDQVCPMHFHWKKMEDIINRGGGIMMMQLYNSLPNEDLDRESPVTVVSDGFPLFTLSSSAAFGYSFIRSAKVISLRPSRFSIYAWLIRLADQFAASCFSAFVGRPFASSAIAPCTVAFLMLRFPLNILRK